MEKQLWSNYFKTSHTPNPSRKGVWKIIAAYLQKKYIPNDSRVLDLGAGYCEFINNIRARERFAVDASNIIETYAEKNVQTYIRECTDLSNFKNETFDVVFLSNLLEHLNQDDSIKTLIEIRRILKQNGKIIILQPNFSYAFRNYFDDFTHKQIFTHVGLSELLQCLDFKIKKVYPKFMPFSLRSKLPTFSWIIKAYLYSPFKPFAGQMLIIGVK